MVLQEGEYLDADYWTSLQDVDLAWRLRSAGWKALYVPTALVYHHRPLAVSEKSSWRERLRLHSRQPRHVSMYAMRNRFFTVWKNETVWNAFLAAPWILWVDFWQLCISCVWQPWATWGCFKGTLLLPRMWKKRRMIRRMARASSKELRRWFR